VLDEEKLGHVKLMDVTDALQAAGLDDAEAIHFASLILNLMDLDKSLTIDHLVEFVAFAMVSKAVEVIRNKTSKCFGFVDASMAMVESTLMRLMLL
jgi:hypothetical protein